MTSADLRAWRARERLSQASVAKLFKKSQRIISRWEQDDKFLPKQFDALFMAVLTAFYKKEDEQ